MDTKKIICPECKNEMIYRGQTMTENREVYLCENCLFVGSIDANNKFVHSKRAYKFDNKIVVGA